MAYPDVDAALYALLSNTTAITALVGTRISYMQAKAGETMPYIVYYDASTVFPNDHNGERGNTVYRVAAYATTRASALAIAQAIYDALHLQPLSLSGWAAWWMAVDNKTSLSDIINGVLYYQIVQDVRVRYDK